MKLTDIMKIAVVLQMLWFRDLNIREHSLEETLKNKIYNLLKFSTLLINTIVHLIMILFLSNKSLILISTKFKGLEIQHPLEWVFNFLIKFREIHKQEFRPKLLA